MKNLIGLIVTAVCLAVMPAKAVLTVTNYLNPVSLAGTPAVIVTNYGIPVLVGYVFIPNPPYTQVYHGAMTRTNDVIYNLQAGLTTQSNLMNTILTIYPTTNIAETIVAPPGTISVPLYYQLQTIVTNTVLVSGSALFNNP